MSLRATGLIINGIAVDVPFITVVNYFDDARLRLKIGEDGARRPKHAVTSIVLHTTRGAPDSDDTREQVIRPGAGPSSHAGVEVNIDWHKDGRCAGAHLVVDFDGVVYCLADLLLEMSYHATSVNPSTIGIEIKQGNDCEMYDAQLDAVVRLCNWLTYYFGIQRQIPDKYRGPVARLEAGARDYRGVFGHRDQTGRRGRGDPGDPVMERLARAGYEAFRLDRGDDRMVWRARQRALGMHDHDVDGIPGQQTTAELVAHGYKGGLWAMPPGEAA